MSSSHGRSQERAVSRRAVLRGAGGIAVTLPWLETFARADAPKKKRFMTFFHPGGTFREQWKPSGTETNFTLNTLTAPLERHKARLVFIDGCGMNVTEKGPGDNHQKGMGATSTGMYLASGTVQGSGAPAAGFPAGPSIDQKIAATLSQGLKFPSIEFGVCCLSVIGAGGGGTPWDYIAYADANQPLPPQEDPVALYARLFKDLSTGSAPDPTLTRQLAERKSVLDVVLSGATSMRAKLSTADQARMDEHFGRVRDLELSLTIPTTTSDQCVKPPAPVINYKDSSQFPKLLDLQGQLLTMALACDLTRVVSLQCERGASDMTFSWLGLSEGHHGIQHESDGSPGAQLQSQIITWYATQFAALLDRLVAIPDGNDGSTLLDNMLIYWCNDLGRGNNHALQPVPIVLAGGASGALRTGRFLSFPSGTAHNGVLVSCMNAMGVAGTTFGDPDFKGALPGLL